MTAFVKVALADRSVIAIGLDFIRTIEAGNHDTEAKITLDDGRVLNCRASFKKVSEAVERLAAAERSGAVDDSLFGRIFGPMGGR